MFKLIIILLIGLNSCGESKYVKYKPHYLSSNHDKYFGKVELDSVEFANTLQVLGFYKEDYKIKNGNVILITKKLANDWELLWNFTIKANDNTWLKTHKLK